MRNGDKRGEAGSLVYLEKKSSYLGQELSAVSFWKLASSDLSASPIVLDPGPAYASDRL